MLRKVIGIAVLCAFLAGAALARADGPTTLGLGTLTAMALSPDGTRLAVGTTIGVYVYDAQTFAPVSSWETGSVVERVWWSPRGDALAVISNAARQLELRAAAGGGVWWSLAAPACADECRYRWAFSSDGASLLVATGKAVEVRDAGTGTLAQSLSSGSAVDYHSIAFGPQGQLAACCADRQTQIWDVAAGKVTNAIYAAEGDQLAWSPDSKILSAGGRLWDLGTKLPRGWGYTNDWIGSLVFSPDGRRVAASDGYGAVRVWTIHDDTLRRVLIGHKAFITDLAWASDGTLYSAGDNAVRAWDADTGQQLRVLDGFSPASRHVAWSPDGRSLFSIENEQLVKADVATRLPVAAVTLSAQAVCGSPYCFYYLRPISDVRVSPAGDVVAVASRGGAALYDATSLRFLRRLPTGYPVFRAAFSPDGRLLVTGGDSPYVVVWDVATGTPQTAFLLSPQKSFTVAVAFGADGQTVYALNGDGAFRRWDLGTGAPLQSQLPDTLHDLRLCWYLNPPRQEEDFMDNCSYQIGAAVIGPSAGQAAIQHDDGIAVADLTTGQTLYTLAAPGVRTLAINPQGTRLAAGVGNVVMIWNLSTGELVAEYTGHTGLVNDVAFNPDGSSLASGSRDGTLRIWSVP